MIDWSKLPDLLAVALLTCAFASVSLRGHRRASTLWLIAWATIVVHFAAFMFLKFTGFAEALAGFLELATLASAGQLFQWAAIPYAGEVSSKRMFASILATNVLYLGISFFAPDCRWALYLGAVLVGAAPLAITCLALPVSNHPLRWFTVARHLLLAAFLLAFQNHPGNGAEMARSGLLFAVFLGCVINFMAYYRRATTGAWITIAGFLAWSSAFIATPVLSAYLPQARTAYELWNLPKYVVAVGMILLVLEEQIDHNKFLAFHDELTGLPNRRLFHDRLNSALARAQRAGAKTALLLVDLDSFKEVNDRLGHHTGDHVLKTVSSLFLARVRRSDTIARTGGDEFCVVLEMPTSLEDAQRVADSLLELVRKPLAVDGHSVLVGASIGIAVYPEDATDPEKLLIAADLRMYADKQARSKSTPEPARGGAATVGRASASEFIG